jgi:FkbM family methyltransferase
MSHFQTWNRGTLLSLMIKRLVQLALGKFGLRIVRTDTPVQPADAFAGLHSFFEALSKRGFNPQHIVDVGANRGIWTRKAIAYFPDAQYTLIEPQDHLKAEIQDLLDRGCRIIWINAGAADTSGRLPFTISPRDDSSSFAPLSAFPPESRRIAADVTTLNEVVAGNPIPEMVKIDAEGFDLKVLAGATDLLGKTEIFFIEAAVLCPELENTVAEVVRRMDIAGYQVADVTDINRSQRCGILWLLELAFIKRSSSLFQGATYE